jgi:integrase
MTGSPQITGSLQQKKGWYYVVVPMHDANGKTKYKWHATHTQKKREATAEMRRILNELEQSQVVYSKERTFIDWLNHWMNEKALNITKNTDTSYRWTLTKYIVPYFEPLKLNLSEVTTQHLQDYYTSKQREGLSPRTIKKHSVILHGALKTAYQRDLIPRNPADKVELPRQAKQDKFRGKAYTAEQAHVLLTAMADDVLYTAILLALFYGLRRSEVCGLRWKDIDFEAKTMTICHTRTQVGEVSAQDRTKSAASHRTLTLIDSTIPTLRTIHRKQLEQRMLLGSEYYIDPDGNDYVCVWPDGRPFLPEFVTHHFRDFLIKNNLPLIRFHDLRHTAGSLLLESGATIKQVQEFMGHEQASTTLDVYAHTSPESRKDTAERLGDVLKINVG